MPRLRQPRRYGGSSLLKLAAKKSRIEVEANRLAVEETERSLERRLRRLEKKYGLRRHRVVFQPGRKVYDDKGIRLDAHIPKVGERFHGSRSKNIKRELGVIYAYPPRIFGPGMAWIETAVHELIEEFEDERDKPAIYGINRLIKCLDDLIISILNDKGSSPQLLQTAISKRREVSKLLPKLREEIYQARERVVEALTPIHIRRTIVTDADMLERGRQAYVRIYNRKLNVPERMLELIRLTKWEKICLDIYLDERPWLRRFITIGEEKIIKGPTELTKRLLRRSETTGSLPNPDRSSE